ncbi:MAG: hypothetical protein H6871_08465 [Methylobacteriaceae bacterium]|nr:hypothetical protein [Methylobacteriaceae bacterium]
MVATVIALAVTYVLTKHLPVMPMVTAAMVVICGDRGLGGRQRLRSPRRQSAGVLRRPVGCAATNLDQFGRRRAPSLGR